MHYGEKGRSEGYKYEDIILTEISSRMGTKLYRRQNSKVENKLGGRKTTAKADLLCDIPGKGISIKNPGKSGASLQLFIPSLNNLIKELSSVGAMPDSVKRYFTGFFGFKSKQEHKDFCKENEIDYAGLNKKHEQRRHRCLHGSMPSSWQTETGVYLNQPIIKKCILEISFSTGFCKDKIYHADSMIWALKKNSVDEIAYISDLSGLLDDLCLKHSWKPNTSTWHFGPMSFQMKGSGGVESASYHSPQFKATIKKIIEDSPSYVFSGNMQQVIEKHHETR